MAELLCTNSYAFLGDRKGTQEHVELPIHLATRAHFVRDFDVVAITAVQDAGQEAG